MANVAGQITTTSLTAKDAGYAKYADDLLVVDGVLSHADGTDIRPVTSPVNNNQWAIADFEALCDYIKVKETAGLIQVLSPSEFFAALPSNYSPAPRF